MLPQQGGSRTLGDQGTLVNHSQVIAQALHDLEDVGRQEDRAAAGDEARQERLDLP